MCVNKMCVNKMCECIYNIYVYQPSCKKDCSPQKGQGEKSCEIKGGSQEMAVMVSQWQKILITVESPSETWRRQHKFI